MTTTTTTIQGEMPGCARAATGTAEGDPVCDEHRREVEKACGHQGLTTTTKTRDRARAFYDAAIELGAAFEQNPTAAFMAVRPLGLSDALDDFLRTYQALDSAYCVEMGCCQEALHDDERCADHKALRDEDDAVGAAERAAEWDRR